MSREREREKERERERERERLGESTIAVYIMECDRPPKQRLFYITILFIYLTLVARMHSRLIQWKQ